MPRSFLLTSSAVLALQLMCLLIGVSAAHRRYCPDGEDWYYFNGNCYLWSPDTEGWFGAEMRCRQLGGHLVSIGSSAENTFLHAMAQCSTHFWIGMANINARRREFVWWADGDKGNYTEKLSVRSSDHYNCVYFDTYGTSRWYNTFCQSLYHYVCMTPPLEHQERQEQGDLLTGPGGNATGVATEAANIDGKNSHCPSGWLGIEDHCYFVSSAATNYFNAQMSCEAKGAYVASVLSEREQTLLTMAIGCGAHIWIGLEKVRPCFSDPSKDFCWMWMDRTALNFTAWYSGYPSSTKEVECATTDGRWRSTNCYNEYRYVCKK